MRLRIDAASFPIVFVVCFLVLAFSFLMDWWATPYAVNTVYVADSTFAEPTTVRQSAAEMVRTGGDASMLECYACHEPDDPPALAFDDDGRLIWEEHRYDFELRHGANHRNEYCYTCHAREQLDRLRTPDGRLLAITEGNALCGACHGTTYRDWEYGIHGRVTGYWRPALGPSRREDCTACHNAHTPAFPALAPWPAPQPLRPNGAQAEAIREEE